MRYHAGLGIYVLTHAKRYRNNTHMHAYANPRKTWKMAGRPDKSGKRNELTIGLYDHCEKSFRKVLAKRKV